MVQADERRRRNVPSMPGSMHVVQHRLHSGDAIQGMAPKDEDEIDKRACTFVSLVPIQKALDPKDPSTQVSRYKPPFGT